MGTRKTGKSRSTATRSAWDARKVEVRILRNCGQFSCCLDGWMPLIMITLAMTKFIGVHEPEQKAVFNISTKARVCVLACENCWFSHARIVGSGLAWFAQVIARSKKKFRPKKGENTDCDFRASGGP